MKDRFDLESEIANTHNFCEYLDDLQLYVLETDEIDVDYVSNYLLSVSTLLKSHANKMMDSMCQVLKLDNYNPDLPY